MKSLIVLAVFVSCGCANPTRPFFTVFPERNGGRITNGQDAARDQFPYQVSFEWGYSGAYQAWCGGSIISPLYVLTAGHCITELPSFGSRRIVAGILDINESGVTRDVASNLVHPLYVGNGQVGPYDLALLRLSAALSFSESVQPIALPAAGSDPQGQAVLSGWGVVSSGQFADILQYVNVPILSYEECAAAFAALPGGSSAPLDVTNVCTGPLYEAIAACSGDSGGPLAQTGPNGTEIIGVVSWGVSPCGYPGAPSVYVKVSSFIDFITENVPDLP